MTELELLKCTLNTANAHIKFLNQRIAIKNRKIEELREKLKENMHKNTELKKILDDVEGRINILYKSPLRQRDCVECDISLDMIKDLIAINKESKNG